MNPRQIFKNPKKIILEQAREKDFIVPRIKKNHLEKLHEVAKNEKVALVDIELDTNKDDIRYFIDYCHPIGDANKYIAEGIWKKIQQFEKGIKKDKPIKIKKHPKPSGARQRDNQITEDDFALPTEHYTLY